MVEKKKYTLIHKDIEVARVTELYQDFPNLSGNYMLSEHLENENSFLFQYVEYSIKSDILMEENYGEWEKFSEKEEIKYIDLIESKHWFLVDKTGKKHKIVIPLFYNNNYIGWRWRL